MDYLSEALEVLCSSFFGRPLLLDATRDPQYNMKQYNKMNFIHISNILLQDSEKKLKKHVLYRIWSQSWHTSRAVGGRTMLTTSGGRRNHYSHERSTWRLRTPTICRRSVPAQCNAGLPKKKTLQPSKINRKTNQIVLVSTMPSQSILSCYLYWSGNTIYNQRGFHLNAIQGHTY